ncbi:hypothetical protein V5O48_016404 [Marasmius crinis-equi]|uniref:Uncharacterized protein n=1 Tax=Marasmius crinis-equi TaxID=585013 RepID=A0ABR3ES43_9AGAR
MDTSSDNLGSIVITCRGQVYPHTPHNMSLVIRDLSSRAFSFEEDCQKIKGEKAQLLARLSSVEREAELWQQRCHTSVDQAGLLGAKALDDERTIRDLQHEVRDLEEQALAFLNQKRDAQSLVGEQRETIARLEEENTRLKREADSTRPCIGYLAYELERARRGNPATIFHLLMDLLVEEEWDYSLLLGRFSSQVERLGVHGVGPSEEQVQEVDLLSGLDRLRRFKRTVITFLARVQVATRFLAGDVGEDAPVDQYIRSFLPERMVPSLMMVLDASGAIPSELQRVHASWEHIPVPALVADAHAQARTGGYSYSDLQALFSRFARESTPQAPVVLPAHVSFQRDDIPYPLATTSGGNFFRRDPTPYPIAGSAHESPLSANSTLYYPESDGYQAGSEQSLDAARWPTEESEDLYATSPFRDVPAHVLNNLEREIFGAELSCIFECVAGLISLPHGSDVDAEV